MSQVAGSSGLAPMFVADDGRNAIVVVPGANGKMDRATVDKHAELIRSAGMVLCQLEIPMDTLSYTLDFCARDRRAGDARSRAGGRFAAIGLAAGGVVHAQRNRGRALRRRWGGC